MLATRATYFLRPQMASPSYMVLCGYEGHGWLYSVGVRSPQRTNTARWGPRPAAARKALRADFYGTAEAVPLHKARVFRKL
jgi:hypothetical protein